MKIRQMIFGLLLILASPVPAAEWQWSVPVKGLVSDETNTHPDAFLWIPPGCRELNGVVVGFHNMSEEGILEHPAFRKGMADAGLATVWVTPGLSQTWDPASGIHEVFEAMMGELAGVSGYDELRTVPVVPIGHSAMATFPWNFGAFHPERTLAILSVHGDSPRTHLTGYGRPNVPWEYRSVAGIPALMVMGEYEWWEDRLFTSLDYRKAYPDAPISLLADAGHGHFDHSDMLVSYLALFLKKAVRARVPAKRKPGEPFRLLPVSTSSGWLAPRWYPDSVAMAKAAPAAAYAGDPNSAFWYFDQEMAKATEAYYRKARNKEERYIGFEQDGTLLPFNIRHHARFTPAFKPQADGITFTLDACFTDSLRANRACGNTAVKPRISRICGPVEQLDDTTFRVSFYRMGMHNRKRTNSIWLLASHPGDKRYKSSVQQLTMTIPYRNTEGQAQEITFEPIGDVKLSDRASVDLQAHASGGLPVSFYVKQGPAEISGNRLTFTRIPPRTRFPVRVTVVAWQYGRTAHPAIQSAEPVEQTFYIHKQ